MPNSYLSPEMIKGEPYGCEADLWAVGVLMYLMALGVQAGREWSPVGLWVRFECGGSHLKPFSRRSFSPDFETSN